MTPILLSLLTILTPLPQLSEPLTLTTGEVITARYVEPSDEFCLELGEFARVQSDLLNSEQYWTRKINLLKASFIEELGKVQDNHKAVHQAYLDEQAKLKELTAKAIEERNLARDDMWWWRGATLGLSLSTTVTIIYLISR